MKITVSQSLNLDSSYQDFGGSMQDVMLFKWHVEPFHVNFMFTTIHLVISINDLLFWLQIEVIHPGVFLSV